MLLAALAALAARPREPMAVQEPEPVVLTPAAKNELLKVLAHLITIGAMTGGTYAISCYISPNKIFFKLDIQFFIEII